MNQLYKLTPYEDGLESHHWKSSIYKGEVTICAPSKDRARSIASLVFSIGTEIDYHQETSYNPWRDHMGLVHIDEISNHKEDLCTEKIVSPAEYDEELQKILTG